MSSTWSKYHVLHLLQNIRGPMTIPKPKINPSSIRIKFQSIIKWVSPIPKLEWDSSNVGPGASMHSIVIGYPHNPLFPSKESSDNNINCLLCGIGPINWLNERFRTARKIKPSASCIGISPMSLLLDKSNDSSWAKFPRDGGIQPVRALCDKLRPINDLSSPNSSGIGP